MKLSECDFGNLDLWTWWLKASTIVAIVIIIELFAYKFFIEPKLIFLKNTRQQGQLLIQQLQSKQAKAREKHNHSSSPLTLYELNKFKLGGILKSKNKIWAIIMTPNGKVYHITYGDKVGKHLAHVDKISLTGVRVVERVHRVTRKIWMK